MMSMNYCKNGIVGQSKKNSSRRLLSLSSDSMKGLIMNILLMSVKSIKKIRQSISSGRKVIGIQKKTIFAPPQQLLSGMSETELSKCLQVTLQL